MVLSLMPSFTAPCLLPIIQKWNSIELRRQRQFGGKPGSRDSAYHVRPIRPMATSACTRKMPSKHGRVPKRQIVFQWKWPFSTDEMKSLNQVGPCLPRILLMCLMCVCVCACARRSPLRTAISEANGFRNKAEKVSYKNMLELHLLHAIVRIKTVRISDVLRLHMANEMFTAPSTVSAAFLCATPATRHICQAWCPTRPRK